MDNDEEWDIVFGFAFTDKEQYNAMKTLHGELFPVQYREAFYRKLAQQLVWRCVTRDSAQLIGCVTARVVDCGSWFGGARLELYIMTLGVTAAYQRRGIARQLLRVAEEHAATLGVRRVSLHAKTINARALQFYCAAGFVNDGRLARHYCIDKVHYDAYELSKRVAHDDERESVSWLADLFNCFFVL